MQTLWLPAPVLVYVRRVVNLVSLSLSHHCLSQSSSQRDVSGEETSLKQGVEASLKLWEAFRFIQWPRWINTEHKAVPRSDAADAGEDEQSNRPVNDTEPEQAPSSDDPRETEPAEDILHRYLKSSVLYDPFRKPRNPIGLCHGLYGFDVRGPSAIPMLQMHYWSNVLSILQDKLGVEVIVTSVPSTGSVALRAESLHRFLREKAVGKGINFIAHSMGGLDCRYLISRIRPTEYIPLSLTTVATPHRGSPFMDWCREHIGIGRLHHNEHAKTAGHALAEMETGHSSHSLHTEEEKAPSGKSSSSITSLPSSFTTLLLSLLDSPAYANLTSTYLNHVFNPQTPDNPAVKYFSVAGRIDNVSVWHPLWLPKMVLDGFEERERERLREQSDPRWERSEEWGNDCLVTVQSARWGQFLGIMEGCDHWDLRGARGLDVELPSISIPGLSIARGKGKKDNGRKREEENGEWNIADWTRFVQLWKSEEKAAKEAAREAGAEISKERQRENQAAESGGKPDKEQADEVLKSSTDKLSAVFDWIVEQMPAPSSLKPLSAGPTALPAKQDLPLEVSRSEREKIKKRTKRGDLATKQDLERFYIALCRNLYDEGL